MAGKQIGAAVRQFQKLLAGGTVCGLTDDQLLARFISHRDDAAFEALMERHGPMVLSVCRGVLKDPNDAQDAFQATFLVLVRKAGSIRAGASLASWLYRVAYNVAIQFNTDTARRQRLERRAGEMAKPTARESSPGDDLVPVLYEEVNRLPEKYRLPLVLCHLEEMTHAQAARQLGWTEGTVRGRVAKGREVLRYRLVRRGLVLSVGAIASALTERSATAAVVPLAWLEGTVKAAMAMVAGRAVAAGTVSASAVAFSEQIARSMFMTKLKLTVAALLAAGGAAFVATLAAVPDDGAMRKDAPPTRTGAMAKVKTAVAASAVSPIADGSKPISFSGHVVDPDGRPVAGAKLYVTEDYDIHYVSPPAPVQATTEADGRFSFRVVPGEMTMLGRSPVDQTLPVVVAMAGGFGPGFGLEREKSGELTIRLARDDIPVEGRVLDTDGQPVVGARAQVVSILWAPGDDLSPWREALRAGEAALPLQYRMLRWWSSRAVAELFPAATTGSDGRFILRGIGRERIAGVVIEGPKIRTTHEQVVTAPEPSRRVPNFAQPSPPSFVTFHGARFDHVAEPSRPIEGIVRDKETGKPVGGAIVRSTLTFGNPGRYVQTATDAQGRYRLTGLKALTGNEQTGMIREVVEEVTALCTDQPYLPAVKPILEPLATRSVMRDFDLKRGIWIRGRVIDKETGQPRQAMLDYFLFGNNPHASEVPELDRGFGVMGNYRTAADGTFRLIGLPGRGLLCARAGNEAYRMGVGADRLKQKESNLGFDVIPVHRRNVTVNNYHILAEIKPPEGIQEATFDLALDRGHVIKGRVLDPEGRPLAGARTCGLIDFWGYWAESLPSAGFEVTGLAPGELRMVAFLHAERRLAGSVILRGETQGPVDVKLEPWGVLIGRLVDDLGQPRAGITLMWEENQNRRVETGPASLPEQLKTDSAGRFRIEGLAPGLRYSLWIFEKDRIIGHAFKDMTAKAGETRDLGDVKKLGE